ncbi:MAG: hypothetical protein M1356_03850 [Gammaproteobacteria bacterium]|nr:hypothetical protein [Gammaproteobacteria bacterium]
MMQSKFFRIVAASIAVLFGLTACQPMYSPELKGEWRITGFHTSTNAELTDEEALSWLGYSVHFGERRIQFSRYDCHDPKITTDWQQLNVVTDRLGVAPDLFGMRGETPVQLLFIDCHGEPWFTPGAELIRLDDERLIMAWNGVIFEFRQQRSTR